MFSRTLTLLLLATFLTLVITVTSVAGLSADAKRTGQNIAVCSRSSSFSFSSCSISFAPTLLLTGLSPFPPSLAIPKCIPSPKQVSNLARGITFETCVDPALKSDPAFSLVHVSIQPDSGFKQQLWDAGDSLDTYWLKQVSSRPFSSPLLFYSSSRFNFTTRARQLTIPFGRVGV